MSVFCAKTNALEKYLNVYCPYKKSKYGPIQHFFFGLTLTETGQDNSSSQNALHGT